VIDLVFLGANLMKILEGGYVPLLIAARGLPCHVDLDARHDGSGAQGRANRSHAGRPVEITDAQDATADPGTAIYLTAHPEYAPVALMHSLKHFKSLHEDNVILTVVTSDKPRVPDSRPRVRSTS
jgi:KUP system potassium uptake protein